MLALLYNNPDCPECPDPTLTVTAVTGDKNQSIRKGLDCAINDNSVDTILKINRIVLTSGYLICNLQLSRMQSSDVTITLKCLRVKCLKFMSRVLILASSSSSS